MCVCVCIVCACVCPFFNVLKVDVRQDVGLHAVTTVLTEQTLLYLFPHISGSFSFSVPCLKLNSQQKVKQTPLNNSRDKPYPHGPFFESPAVVTVDADWPMGPPLERLHVSCSGEE